jgi:hypothetical protein
MPIEEPPEEGMNSWLKGCLIFAGILAALFFFILGICTGHIK